MLTELTHGVSEETRLLDSSCAIVKSSLSQLHALACSVDDHRLSLLKACRPPRPFSYSCLPLCIFACVHFVAVFLGKSFPESTACKKVRNPLYDEVTELIKDIIILFFDLCVSSLLYWRLSLNSCFLK